MRTQRFFGEGENSSPTLPAAPALLPAGFVVCPLPLGPYAGVPGGWAAQEVYRIAYERAQAGLRPSWRERVLMPSLN